MDVGAQLHAVGGRARATQANRVDVRRQRQIATDLAHALSRSVEGEVRFDAGSRALYATDLSIYRHVPIGVVIPRHVADVMATVAACRARDVPILGRGTGTSLCGQTCNVAVVIDFSKYMNRILALDPDAKMARVEPGVINDELRAAAQKHGLTYAPDPATHPYCTIGGNIGNNSCGAHTVMGGKTVDNVIDLDILTYDGLRIRVGETSEDQLDLIRRSGGRRAEIYLALKALAAKYGDEIRRRYPKIPRRVSGYNLDSLLPEKGFHIAQALVGSESTCALTLAATLRLIDYPPKRALLLLGYKDAASAADDVAQIRSFGPDAIEGFHEHVITNMERKGKKASGKRFLPEGRAWLMVEFGGQDQKEANDKAERAYRALKRAGTGALGMRVVEKESEQQEVWHIRENGVGASRIPEEEDSWPSWEDAAVPPERLGDYLREFDKLNERFGYKYTLFGHFGDGCVHTRMTFGLKTKEGIAKFRRYMEEASDLCLKYGGSLSGEHGDGQAKGELLPKMFGPEIIQAFREFKTIWDPHWRMNPGKVIDAQPLDANIRVGPDHNPMPVSTYFHFIEDSGSFAHATERCFGVGRCRIPHGSIMCPSFQATREEMHSTRGRAHLLFEMLRGDPLQDGWRDPAVREALDLCLQCKGCKHDCPVSVDMATYKAEFLAHYYEGRLRPRAAYSMGLVFLWARLAMLAPWVPNLLLHAPGLGKLTRALAGFTTRREAPAFPEASFQRWFARRKAAGDAAAPRPSVVLWPDTFNNYFLPGTAKAAVTVLEDAGFRVIVPQARVCCGRPLYDYGMLDLAKRQLQRTVDLLRPAIRDGIPIVGLEPSCVSVFRDELVNMLPEDEDARRLAKQTKMLGEFLMGVQGWQPPRLEGEAFLHQHCHHKAVLDAASERKLLERMGLELHGAKAGCCGHAGSFGYEAEHYDISMQIAELNVLPAARKASREALVIAEGFSCRQQIEHGAGRWPMHPAEVLALAIEARGKLPEQVPERRYLEPPAQPGIGAAVVAAGLLAGAVLLWSQSRASARRS
jgi:FAD/FMN-containing dehydrogenase/Fe-S oxidoreductase